MAEGLTEDSAMDLALECGADDVEQGIPTMNGCLLRAQRS